MNESLKSLKIVRNKKYNVGKKIGNQIWIHKNYISELMNLDLFEKFKSKIPDDFNYVVLRWDEKKQELAFIESVDFNTSNEPLVGDSLRVLLSQNEYVLSKRVIQQKDPLIYHHKWLFVKDDYVGFNVKESKLRSIEWKSYLGVNSQVTSRIGRLSFWDNWLNDNNLSKRLK
jgi:hypothetical protein